MFSIAFKVLMLSPVLYATANNHSIVCPNGNPAFDIDCKASHAPGTHGCRNSCKVTCSMGNKKQVLLLQSSKRMVQKSLKYVMNHRRLYKWILVSIGSLASLDSYSFTGLNKTRPKFCPMMR